MSNFVVCDDNCKFGEYLKTMILQNDPSAGIVVYPSIKEMTTALEKSSSPVDIFFMDIMFENEVENGIETAKSLHLLYPNSEIIFISEFASFISDVYLAPHCFFIKKSDIEAYLPKAIEKAFESIERRKIVLKSSNGQIAVTVEDIIYIERVQRESTVYLTNGHYCTRSSLEELVQILPPSKFVRCHCSFIVNIPRISRYYRTSCVLENGVVIPISRKYCDAFKSKMLKYWGKLI